MANPVAQIKRVHQSVRDDMGHTTGESQPLYDSVIVYCPGCKMSHPFRIKVYQPEARRSDDTEYPIWEWNGSLEKPTFSPSLLVGHSVHLCEGQHAPVKICDQEFGECEHRGHGYVWVNDAGEQRFFKVYETVPEGFERHTYGGGAEDPHVKDPAWGNCHSFLRDGVWEFLSDCAHPLAGQRVPLEPLPDWLVREDA